MVRPGTVARQAGIKITLSASNFSYMISNYLDPVSPANEDKWAWKSLTQYFADPEFWSFTG